MREPTPFSKKFPPKRRDLPDELRSMLTWDPTEKLEASVKKPLAKDAPPSD